MYSSPNITRLIKEMCGAWHVWGKEEVPTGFWWEPEGKNHLEDPEIYGRLILK
jgi:hypothetical protein